jgi:hypothetical protein
MPNILLFTSHTCPKCPSVREKLKDVPHEEYFMDTVEGMAEAAYYDVLTVPTVIVLGREEARFTGDLPDGWREYID